MTEPIYDFIPLHRRQELEIEKLKAENERFQLAFDADQELIVKLRREAERLKEYIKMAFKSGIAEGLNYPCVRCAHMPFDEVDTNCNKCLDDCYGDFQSDNLFWLEGE